MKMETALDAAPPQVGTPSYMDPGGHFSPGVVEVKVEKAADLDEALHNAFTLLLKAAIEHKTGIMVTRIGVGRYIVQTHPEVPVGLIRERYI